MKGFMRAVVLSLQSQQALEKIQRAVLQPKLQKLFVQEGIASVISEEAG